MHGLIFGGGYTREGGERIFGVLRYIYATMKSMCFPGYHHNDFVATHALRYMMYSYHKAILVVTGKAHCFHDCIYITVILLL